MPITQERQTIQDLRSAGFTQQQAEVLADKLETAAQATQQDLKSFIRAELAALEGRSDVKFAELRTELHSTQKDLAFKLIATIVAAISLAVAIIKIFPNVQ